MCASPIPQISDEAKVEMAKYALAHLFKSKLSVDIDADDLGKFIVKHWRLISPLAHIIHGAAAPPYEFSGGQAQAAAQAFPLPPLREP